MTVWWGLAGLLGLLGCCGLLRGHRADGTAVEDDPLARYPVAREPATPNADAAHTPLMTPVITPEMLAANPRHAAAAVPESGSITGEIPEPRPESGVEERTEAPAGAESAAPGAFGVPAEEVAPVGGSAPEGFGAPAEEPQPVSGAAPGAIGAPAEGVWSEQETYGAPVPSQHAAPASEQRAVLEAETAPSAVSAVPQGESYPEAVDSGAWLPSQQVAPASAPGAVRRPEVGAPGAPEAVSAVPQGESYPEPVDSGAWLPSQQVAPASAPGAVRQPEAGAPGAPEAVSAVPQGESYPEPVDSGAWLPSQQVAPASAPQAAGQPEAVPAVSQGAVHPELEGSRAPLPSQQASAPRAAAPAGVSVVPQGVLHPDLAESRAPRHAQQASAPQAAAPAVAEAPAEVRAPRPRSGDVPQQPKHARRDGESPAMHPELAPRRYTSPPVERESSGLLGKLKQLLRP
ncbi:hypothetical protein [Amycolatopsis sp. cmx-4-61]|uniref:hypothetical protein n=1 Tax=Amycolatopsis sp. cmx-4-61 TaxID=2790937 RepID=UPI00397BA062